MLDNLPQHTWEYLRAQWLKNTDVKHGDLWGRGGSRLPGEPLGEQLNSVHLVRVAGIQHHQAVEVPVTHVTCDGPCNGTGTCGVALHRQEEAEVQQLIYVRPGRTGLVT